MKKVFALLTIVSVMSFVACKPKANDDEQKKKDSIRVADSLEKIRIEDSTKAANDAAAAMANDTTGKGDSANMPK